MRGLFSLIAAAASLLTAHVATAALKPGSKAPEFQAPASLAGKAFGFDLDKALKKGPVVVYFYPAAYTSGCNVEAHSFAQSKRRFDRVGATIIGVSRDGIARLNDFSADPRYCGGKFPVAADPDGAIARSYDLNVLEEEPGEKDSQGRLIDHAQTERTTFVIGRDGIIIATLSSADDHIEPAEHVERSLAIVRGLKRP